MRQNALMLRKPVSGRGSPDVTPVGMNIITCLLTHGLFHDHVASTIIRKAEGMVISVPMEDGDARGDIKAFRLLGPPVFAETARAGSDGVCLLPFSGQAKIAGHVMLQRGGHFFPFSKDGAYSGHVRLSWPEGSPAETGADFAAFYPRIVIETVIDSVFKGPREQAPPRTGAAASQMVPAADAKEPVSTGGKRVPVLTPG